MASQSPRLSRGLRRASALLLALGGLTACVAQPGPAGYGGGPAIAMPAPTGHRIAVLAPLTGSNAELGRSLLRAARLSLQADGGSAMDEMDTKGTPDGAAAAARTAVAAGAGIMVGPLTAAETGAVAAVARPLNIPVLAFTSDDSQARPGVWPMGITTAQQATTLVQAVQADGKRRIGALLPRNAFGDSLGAALARGARDAGLPPPLLVRYEAGATFDDAIGQLAAGGGIEAVVLGSGVDAAVSALPALTRAGLGPDRIRVLGTALWAKDAARAAPLAGAWFTAPDPQAQLRFEQNFMSRYGTAPREIGGIAFDAAGAARAVTSPAGVDTSRLLTPGGFAGAAGAFVLLPDGHVSRTLALFEITPTGVRQRGSPAAAAM